LDLFLASNTPTKSMIHVFYSSGWHIESFGGSTVSNPSATSWLYNRLDVFVRGSDGKMYHDRYPAS
jgi:hypothetical protein